jgi:small subunit ribosomal protein S6
MAWNQMFLYFRSPFFKKLKTKNSYSMSKQYETTLILTPVLTQDELKDLVKNYAEFLKTNGAEIVFEEYWGLKQLAYPIDKKTTGHYYTLEFKVAEAGDLIERLELNYRRDENVLRYLTIMLDKHAADYNDRKHRGLIGRKAKAKTENQEA